MADLTADQLSDLRFDVADKNSAFSDAELQRLWTRCIGARDESTRFEATKGLVIRALLHDAAKFNDYTAGETSEKKSQIFDNLQKLYSQQYQKVVEATLGRNKQVIMAALQDIPHQTRTEPGESTLYTNNGELNNRA